MAFQKWQIGLDIHNGQLCALGVQRRRNGWQLRHWWHHPLPQDTLRQGVLQSSPELLSVLTRWRKMLPRHYRLCVGLPPQLVMQRPLALPPQSLREPDLGRYIHAAARRLFPLEPESLTLDYRPFSDKPSQLCVTAVRRDVLQQWQSVLAEAGVQPEVFELSWAALQMLAMLLKPLPGTVLVHRLPDQWLWYAPGEQQPAFGCAVADGSDLAQLRLHAFPEARALWYSSDMGDEPDRVTPLNPLHALQLMQPPLPVQPSRFALACGLALRPED